MAYSASINRIFANLAAGVEYGYISRWRDDYPEKDIAGKERFESVLFRREDCPLIVWNHYGSSANDATKADLAWIIHTIFKMSAPEFEKRFITRYEFMRRYGRYS